MNLYRVIIPMNSSVEVEIKIIWKSLLSILILTSCHLSSELCRGSYVQRVCNVVYHDFEIVAADFDADTVWPVLWTFPRFLCPARLKCGAQRFRNRCCWFGYWFRVTRARSISEVPMCSAIEIWCMMISKSLMLILMLTSCDPCSEHFRGSYVQRDWNMVNNDFEIVAVGFDTDSASFVVEAIRASQEPKQAFATVPHMWAV